MNWARIAVIAMVSALLVPGGALRADVPGDVPDKVRLSLGGMFVDAFTDAGYGSVEVGIGGSVNFEDIFDLPENEETLRAEVNWHAGKRHFVDFGYFKLDRSSSEVISEDVTWGDYVFKAGSEVSARFNSRFASVAWRYLFIDLPQVRISGSVGISGIGIEAGLGSSGEVTDPDGNPVAETVDESADIRAPVPLLGIQVDWEATRRLSFMLYYRSLYINDVQGIDGAVIESAFRLNWWYAKHAGISTGLDTENIDLRSYESGDTKARFRYSLRCYSLYLTFAF